MNAPTPPVKPFARWRLVLAVFGVLTAALIAWYFIALRDDYTTLYSGLHANDAAAITTELTRRGVHYRLGENGSQIAVPTSQADGVRAQIAASNLSATNSEGFELFDQSDMGLNDFDERIRYQRALQGELQRTIMMMDGVVTARVHISMPDRTPFRAEQQSPSAAVTLVMRNLGDATPASVEGVQRLVAAAVTGLTPADVVVLNERGEVLSPRVEISDISGALLGGDGQAHRTATELVTEVMRQALPNRRFEVSIEQTQAPGGSVDAPVFTRVIRIATAAPLDDADMQRVRVLLHRTGLIDGSLEEAVIFSVGLTADAPSSEPARPLLAHTPSLTPTPTPSVAGFGGALGAVTVLFILALLGAGFLWWRRRSQAVLSPNEHQAFADRLREALAAGNDGGAR